METLQTIVLDTYRDCFRETYGFDVIFKKVGDDPGDGMDYVYDAILQFDKWSPQNEQQQMEQTSASPFDSELTGMNKQLTV